MIKTCDVCKAEIKRKPSAFKNRKNIFCSWQCYTEFQKGKPTWNKGLKLKPLTDEHKRKISESCNKNEKIKETQFKKGHKRAEESIEKQKETIRKEDSFSGTKNGMYGRVGSLNPNWKGGSNDTRKLYYNSIPYKNWRKKVFARDNYICQICGDITGKGKILHAHHIKSYSLYPAIRLAVSNGVTLCNKCHTLVHSNKFKFGTILSVEKTDKTMKMIDIEIKDNNNFFANGVLVHNSATPFREDKNSWMIIALTGYPVGMNWDVLFALGIVKKPDITLYLGKTLQDKKQKLGDLLKIPIKTVVFCDSIELGKRLSRQFEYPFVHGETNPKERIEIIDSASVCFVSRVGDQGLSLDIPRVIEFDFFKGSRRQEIQRMGRVMHSGKKGQHIILMTYDEYDSHHKRIDVLEEKGLRVSKVSIN